MQRHFISAGRALCRYCGERVPTHQLSVHIAAVHPRPKRADLAPTLVRKPRPARAG